MEEKTRPDMVTLEFVDAYVDRLLKQNDKHSYQTTLLIMLRSLGVSVRGGRSRTLNYPMFQRKNDGIFRGS